jgi:hypothetical protein
VSVEETQLESSKVLIPIFNLVSVEETQLVNGI